MNKQEFITKTQELIAASSCCGELKDAAQKWMDAVGTKKEDCLSILFPS